MKNIGGCMIVSAMLILVFLGNSLVLAGDIPLVKPEELKKMIDEGRADIIVVDNQPKGAYDMGHIPGAVNLPWETEIKGSMNLPRNKMLVLYCACTHEEDATDVANQLIEKFGYQNIKLIEGGWLQWVKLGYPVEKSK
jgi:3-mercaptopyruvate sulfurtransferase SseA